MFICFTDPFASGRHLDKLIPLFIKSCGNGRDENQQTEEFNELREYCFPGLESFVLRCRKEVTPFIDDILAVSMNFIKYDPNYTYDDDLVDTMVSSCHLHTICSKRIVEVLINSCRCHGDYYYYVGYW